MAEPDDLTDLFDFLDDDGLTVPGVKSRDYPDGKTYVIPSPDAETGLRLTTVAELMTRGQQENATPLTERELAKLNLDDDEERDFIVQVLGSAYPEMIADGVSWVRIQRINQFAFIHFAFNAEAAQTAARNGIIEGKAPARGNRATRRAAGATTTTRQAQPASAGSRKRRRR